jgi:hypothetical protein
MAEASLFGMVGAVALALGFAILSRRGWRLSWLLVSAVALYAAPILALRGLAPIGLAERLVLPLLALLAASEIGGRIRASPHRRPRRESSARRMLILRTVIPVLCVWLVALVRDFAGTSWAGLFSTFPALTLTLLVVTHLETGPLAASRMACALPSASLSTYAFLAIFRFGCPRLGPASAFAWGYVASLIVLPMVVRLAQRGDVVVIHLRPRTILSSTWKRHSGRQLESIRTRTVRAPVFAPLLEPIH